MSELDDQIINDLIMSGAIEPAGIDSETGEILYSFTEKLESISPQIFHEVMEAFHKDILLLWEAGFLSMDITVANPLVSITEKALDKVETKKLNADQKRTLEIIIQAMSTN